jgi:hypothetical protein
MKQNKKTMKNKSMKQNKKTMKQNKKTIKQKIIKKATKIKRQSKAQCIKQTTKKYVNRPSPPYPAALCVGKIKKGNDGKMYQSRFGINYGPAKWVKI